MPDIPDQFADSEFAPLIAAALNVRARAYAPYSGYHVGAALWSVDRSSLWTGCNVENASYALTICAERVAIAHAVVAGVRSFGALAVATGDGAFPCGACCQALTEFAAELTIVIVDAGRQTLQTRRLNELLPHAFRRHD